MIDRRSARASPPPHPRAEASLPARCGPQGLPDDCVLPHPSDFFPRGGKVVVSGHAKLTTKDGVSADLSDRRSIHGFSRLPLIVAVVGGTPLSEALVTIDEPAELSMDPGSSPTLIVHDESGALIPHFVDIDPLEGTREAIVIHPLVSPEESSTYAVSIAAAVDGGVLAGYVVNVVSAEEWTAVRGEGAWLLDGDGRHRLRAPEPPVIAHLLVGTGFHYVPEIRAEQAAAVARLLPQVRDIRRTGSAALNLCELAAGRLDAFVEQGLNAWDLAAGGLVATEAGLVVQGLDGEPDERLVMAAHPAIAEEYFALVRACGF